MPSTAVPNSLTLVRFRLQTQRFRCSLANEQIQREKVKRKLEKMLLKAMV